VGLAMIKYLSSLVLISVVLGTFNVWGAEYCSVASDVAAKGYIEFHKDPNNAIKLFYKAQQFCPSKPAYLYNLGLAYLKINRPSQAVSYLQEATKGVGVPVVWQNNLAEAYLATNQNDKAVKTAKASMQIRETPHAASVLGRVYYKQGKYIDSLQVLWKAKINWREEHQLDVIYNVILGQYLDFHLSLVKGNNKEQGLAGLRYSTFSDDGLKAYCLALTFMGRFGDALTTLERAFNESRGTKELRNLHTDIIQRQINYFYEVYSRGKRPESVSSAKTFAELYPGNAQVQRAYNELLEAFLSDIEQVQTTVIETKPPNVDLFNGRYSSRILGEFESSIIAKETVELVADIDKDIPKAARKNSNGIAVVIGNQRYKKENKGIADVIYAEHDAATMRKYLVQTLGYDKENIIYETDATLGVFRNVFGTQENYGKLHNFVRSGKSDVFIYYVGHGAPGPDGKFSYLVPIDADVDFIANNGYSVSQLYSSLNQLKARKVTIVLDACFSGDSYAGPLFKKISPAMLRSTQPAKELKGAVVITGSDQGQVVTWYQKKNHSLFTYFFLKGIGGAADKNRDKIVSVKELRQYLDDEVPYFAQRESNRQQNPVVRGDGKIIMSRLK